MTDAERKFWGQVRNRKFRGLKFRRQEPVMGYYADFLCEEARMIVELDGGQHAEQMAFDERRTEVLAKAGFQVLRFWNNDVLMNIDGVMEQVGEAAGIAGHDDNT